MAGTLLLPLVAWALLVQQEQAPEGMVLVPAGSFVMGSDTGNFDERPAHRVELSAFYIDRHEVTNAQFAAHVRATASYELVEGPWFRCSVEGCLDLIAHYRGEYQESLDALPPLRTEDRAERLRELNARARWRSALVALRDMLGEDEGFPGRKKIREITALPAVRELLEAQAELPVCYVTWRDAARYARWAGKRLPTEAEWEKAARGEDGRVYPWGNDWLPIRCRSGLAPSQSAIFDPHASGEPEPIGPAPVGSHPLGASPYGCFDMAGNVWEWVADWYGEYHYATHEAAVDPRGPAGLDDGRLPGPYSDRALLRSAEQGRSTNTRKVLRGGGWSSPANQSPFNTRTTRRLWSNPDYWHSDVGFRCAKDV